MTRAVTFACVLSSCLVPIAHAQGIPVFPRTAPGFSDSTFIRTVPPTSRLARGLNPLRPSVPLARFRAADSLAVTPRTPEAIASMDPGILIVPDGSMEAKIRIITPPPNVDSEIIVPERLWLNKRSGEKSGAH